MTGYTGPLNIGAEFTGFGPVRLTNTGHYPASSGDPAVEVEALERGYTCKGLRWWMPESYFRDRAVLTGDSE